MNRPTRPGHGFPWLIHRTLAAVDANVPAAMKLARSRGRDPRTGVNKGEVVADAEHGLYTLAELAEIHHCTKQRIHQILSDCASGLLVR